MTSPFICRKVVRRRLLLLLVPDPKLRNNGHATGTVGATTVVNSFLYHGIRAPGASTKPQSVKHAVSGRQISQISQFRSNRNCTQDKPTHMGYAGRESGTAAVELQSTLTGCAMAKLPWTAPISGCSGCATSPQPASCCRRSSDSTYSTLPSSICNPIIRLPSSSTALTMLKVVSGLSGSSFSTCPSGAAL